MHIMIVRDVMQTNVITVPHTATYDEVVQLLHDYKITGAPVLDDAGNLIGMISEKDLFRVLYPYYDSFYKDPTAYTDFEKRESKVGEIKDHPVTKFMITEVVTTTPDTPIMKIGGLMLARGFYSVPVLEADKLAGIVSRSDIYKRVLREQLDF